MSVWYADSSALAKLVVAESESAGLVAHLEGKPVVTSELAETELRRVALRAGGEDALSFSEDVLAKVSTVPITTAILRRAGALLPPTLPSLDAIHLATAISLEAVAEFVCYDGQLTQAAAANGLTVGSPS